MVIEVSEKLKHDFKIKCAKNNEQLTCVIRAMMQHYVDNDELGITVREIKKPDNPMRQCWFIEGKIEHLPVAISKTVNGRSTYTHDGVIFGFIDGMLRELPEAGDDKRFLNTHTFNEYYENKYIKKETKNV